MLFLTDHYFIDSFFPDFDSNKEMSIFQKNVAKIATKLSEIDICRVDMLCSLFPIAFLDYFNLCKNL